MHRLPIPLLAPLVAVGPLPAAIALLCSTWRLAVRADLEADVALDLILALTRRFGGGWPGTHRSFTAHMIKQFVRANFWHYRLHFHRVPVWTVTYRQLGPSRPLWAICPLIPSKAISMTSSKVSRYVESTTRNRTTACCFPLVLHLWPARHVLLKANGCPHAVLLAYVPLNKIARRAIEPRDVPPFPSPIAHVCSELNFTTGALSTGSCSFRRVRVLSSRYALSAVCVLASIPTYIHLFFLSSPSPHFLFLHSD